MKKFGFILAVAIMLSGCNPDKPVIASSSDNSGSSSDLITSSIASSSSSLNSSTSQSNVSSDTASSSESSSEQSNSNSEENSKLKQFNNPAPKSEIAKINTTMGDITIMFFPEDAPKAVENFITHAKDGYYNGIIFHRVIPDFMIQGGDPTGTGTGGESIWGKSFTDEFSQDLFNFRGALSMANSGPNTNGSQFFIVQAATVDKKMIAQLEQAGFPAEAIEKYSEVGGTPWLDQRHTVFGQVIEGMDIVDAIANAKTGFQSKPVEDIAINSITFSTVE